MEVAEQAALAGLTPPLSADDAARLAELNAKAARGPLELLLMVIGEQIEAVSYDLDRLYDDQFIETCAPWVIPYIGDLIGYQTINGVSAAVDDPRAEVANTISMRRRKGTILVLEELAQDVTGWGAHAVEMFRTLGDTQYVKHVRPKNHYAPDLRDWRACFYVDTGFNTVSHRVDVRRIETRRGRWNVQNIGVFLWSLGAYGVEQAPLVSAPAVAGSSSLCCRFHPLGIDAPLFHRAISQGDPILAAATPYNVPAALKRRPLCADLSRGVAGQFYGETGSLTLFVNGEPVDPWQIRIADLAGADGAWANATLPPPYLFAIDPELGRLVWQPPTPLLPLTASWCYGANAAMGGGDYPRSSGFTVTDPAWVVPFPDPRFATLAAAVAYAEGLLAEEGSVAVEVAGDAPISLAAPLAITLPAGATLEFRAADGSRPVLWLDGEIDVVGGALSTFILNGFLVAAGPTMSPAAWPASPAALVRVPALMASGAANQLGTLNLIDCTLTPGWSLNSDATPVSPHAPSLIVEAPGVAASTLRAILGAVAAHPLASVEFQGQHRRCDGPHDRRLQRTRWVERRRRADGGGRDLDRQGPCEPHLARLRLHLLVGARQGRCRALGLRARRRPQAGRLRAFQLPAPRRGDAAPLRMRRTRARLGAAPVLHIALRRAGLRKTHRLDAGCGAARRRGWRGNGRLSFRASGPTRNGPHNQADRISAGRHGIRFD